MKLRQLVYLNEVIKQDFNISAAAQALYTSQPGISRQLHTLAEELGIPLFTHQGKRLTGLTEPGAKISALATEVLRGIKRIQEVAHQAGGYEGRLVVVTTRHVADHHLRLATARCHAQMPGVEVRIYEEEPGKACAMLKAGEADLGILSAPLVRSPDFVYFPIEAWRLILVAPHDHPLCDCTNLTLGMLAELSLYSYERSAVSRQMIDETFKRRGFESPITLSLASSATILEYVDGGLGLGIVGEAAFDQASHPTLRAIDISHLFSSLSTDIVLARRTRISTDVRDFIQILVPTLTQEMIEEAQQTCDS